MTELTNAQEEMLMRLGARIERVQNSKTMESAPQSTKEHLESAKNYITRALSPQY